MRYVIECKAGHGVTHHMGHRLRHFKHRAAMVNMIVWWNIVLFNLGEQLASMQFANSMTGRETSRQIILPSED